MIVCFDLEGPLSPQDNAYELMSLIENGRTLFEKISRYDDILTLEQRGGYEPGDTLKLILPFLVSHKLGGEDVKKVSENSTIVGGAREVVKSLSAGGVKVYVISTSYSEHALNIARRLGIPEENVYCTRVDWEKLQGLFDDTAGDIVGEAEGDLKQITEDTVLEKRFDSFYMELSTTAFGRKTEEVKVVGGARKLRAVEGIAGDNGASLSDIVVIGDSITDYKMLQAVRDNGGSSIVFNGNKYALPYGSVGLASETIKPVLELAGAFANGSITKVKQLVESKPNKTAPFFHWIPDLSQKKLSEVEIKHMHYRSIVRGMSSKLG